MLFADGKQLGSGCDPAASGGKPASDRQALHPTHPNYLYGLPSGQIEHTSWAKLHRFSLRRSALTFQAIAVNASDLRRSRSGEGETVDSDLVHGQARCVGDDNRPRARSPESLLGAVDHLAACSDGQLKRIIKRGALEALIVSDARSSRTVKIVSGHGALRLVAGARPRLTLDPELSACPVALFHGYVIVASTSGSRESAGFSSSANTAVSPPA